VDGAHQGAHALALFRGDGVDLGVVEEAELPLQLGLHAVALLLGCCVPLVHCEHQRAAALEDVAGHMRVLLGHASTASRVRMATLAASMAWSALTMEKNSTGVPVLPRLRTPAVSI